MKRSIWLCVLALALGALVVGLGPAAAEPLFAGTSPSGIVYQYMGGTTWDAISPSLGYAVLALTKYEGKLYAGTMSYTPKLGVGKVWRYDGDGLWTLVGDNLGDQVCQLVVYNGDLYAMKGSGVWSQAALDDLRRADVPAGGEAPRAAIRLDPRACYVGRVVREIGDDPSGSRRRDLAAYIDLTAKTIRSLTGELRWD